MNKAYRNANSLTELKTRTVIPKANLYLIQNSIMNTHRIQISP